MKKDCINHPVKVKGKDLKELAFEIENLRYDKVIEFLDHLEGAFKDRAGRDYKAGKTSLCYGLTMAGLKLSEASEIMKDVWKICKKYSI